MSQEFNERSDFYNMLQDLFMGIVLVFLIHSCGSYYEKKLELHNECKNKGNSTSDSVTKQGVNDGLR